MYKRVKLYIEGRQIDIESDEAWDVVASDLENIGKRGFGYLRIPSKGGVRTEFINQGTKLYWFIAAE